MRADQILPTYEVAADAFNRDRACNLFEAPMLEALVRLAPGRRLLDLGCGTGQPLAAHLARRGMKVTGVDGAAAMIAHFQRALPDARAILADMRTLRLRQRFDAILAWNSFFHLSAADQHAMFRVFRAHAAPGAILVLSTGHRAGTAIGAVAGMPVFHASLSPRAYRALLHCAGFRDIRYRPRDRRINCHTWWTARFIA